MAAAKVTKATCDKSVFSYLGMSLRNLLNQECVSSTTQRLGLKLGSWSINFFSSPLGRMCGMKPAALATLSFPTYPASRHKFCTVSLFLGAAIRPFNKASRDTQSFRLAPVTTSDNGTPRSSTRMFRFVPFFSPIRRVRPDRLDRQWRFDHRPIGRLPLPGDSLHFIIFYQAALPESFEEPRARPLLELSMNHRRAHAFKFLSRQRIPDDASAEHINDGCKKQPVCVLPFASSTRLALEYFDRVTHFFRNQRLHQVPELFRNLPCLYTSHDWPPSAGLATGGLWTHGL